MNVNKSLFMLLALLLPITVLAQHVHDHAEGDEVGKVIFPVSCTPVAQKQFENATAKLHSFAYEDAEKAFTEVAATDPNCVMAYWGIAMSIYHPLWAPPGEAEMDRASTAIQKAKTIGAKTKRETDYINAMETFYSNWKEQTYLTRALDYEKAMEQLYLNYPEDQEAAAFYALALNAAAQASPVDRTYARQKKAIQILEKVREKEPQHPGVYHYIIHNCDYPELASLALPAARSYSKIAPSVPHALHMPSHIFTRLGLWEDSIQSNLAAAAASKEYARKRTLGAAYYEQIHAMDYLTYAYLQLGQDKKAKQVLDELETIVKVEPQSFSAAYGFAAIPARYAIERGRWSEAMSLEVKPDFIPWDKFSYAKANIYFARAIGAARSEDIPAAESNIQQLEAIRDSLKDVKDNYRWFDLVEVQRLAAAGLKSSAEGKKEEALVLLRSAADLEDSTEKHPVTPGSIIPARELLGELLLEMKKPQEALTAFEISLEGSPNRLNGLYGAARAAELSGDLKKAQGYYTQLLSLTNQADGDREALRAAKTFAAKMK
jgi:tetratricopeptide (TPR) repeat protein